MVNDICKWISCLGVIIALILAIMALSKLSKCKSIQPYEYSGNSLGTRDPDYVINSCLGVMGSSNSGPRDMGECTDQCNSNKNPEAQKCCQEVLCQPGPSNKPGEFRNCNPYGQGNVGGPGYCKEPFELEKKLKDYDYENCAYTDMDPHSHPSNCDKDCTINAYKLKEDPNNDNLQNAVKCCKSMCKVVNGKFSECEVDNANSGQGCLARENYTSSCSSCS